MDDDFELLSLQSPVGKGQENNPDDIEAIDARLRKIGAYSPPPEYADNPQRYTTEPMIGALERYQERNGLKIDGIANPGGPTERAINNHLLEKPRGAGLLYDPPSALAGTVGNGFENRREDVASVQRRLGALGHLPEDPFDKPHGFIDENTTNGIKAFQRAKGLVDDGWLAPGGETEKKLGVAIAELARMQGREWLRFAERAVRAQSSSMTRPLSARTPEGLEESEMVQLMPAALAGTGVPRLQTPSYYPSETGDQGDARIEPAQAGDIIVPPFLWLLGALGAGAAAKKHLDDQAKRNAEPPPPSPRIPFGVPMPDSSESAPGDRGRPPKPLAEPKVYVPEPGSPLRIPIIDIHRGGARGRPETRETTKDVVDKIEEKCREAFKGIGANFERTYEKYYENSQTGKRLGSSFADGLFRITIGSLTIDFVADTYTPKVDGNPNAAEQSRYMKLVRNMEKVHGIIVRVPKPWALGHVLDKEKLSEATKEVCEQIKKKLDRGELNLDKDKLSLQKLLDKLTKAEPKPGPSDEPNRK